jgi:uncharacterized protein
VELTLFVDHACNLRCGYCYNGAKFSRRMPGKVMRRSVDMALVSRPAALDVSFFGGEPLLHPGFVEETLAYVETAVHALPETRPRVRYVMNTNGTLVDDRALALLSPPRDFTVYVSLDGPAAVHDAHRVDEGGRGSFADIVANLGRMRQAGIAFRLVAVVRPDTAHRLGEVVRTLLDLQPAQATLTPDFHAPWTEESIAELRTGLRNAGEVWSESFRRGQVVPLEPLHGKILTHLKQGIPCPARCTLAGRAFAVAPTGRLYPCAQMIGEDRDDELVIGTVDAGFDGKRLAELQRAKDRVEETCTPCALRERCQSHCGCRHVALTGELGRINQALCETEESFILAADQVASLLVAERCPTFLDTYYRKQYRPAAGATLTRLRRPSDPGRA